MAQAGPYIGADACVDCHAEQSRRWRSSQHAAAMLVATEASVRGDFANTRFADAAGKLRFFKRNDSFRVQAEDNQGKTTELEVPYTFGVEPLQQYLLAFPRGALQALDVAWDTRPAADGGQRWFAIDAGARAATHSTAEGWRSRSHNWNGMCADCHSTHVEKHYDPSADSFATTWSSINVSCEACHGPGRDHASDPQAHPLALSRVARNWSDRNGDGIAERVPEHADRRELETCARCHSRRTELSENFEPGGALLDAYRPMLLESDLYYADGQILAEDYVYGSFVQSAMYRAGVTCSDCHDPHSGQLHANGNALCAQCHDPSRFDVPAHHHHAAGSAGAECIACHMPSRVYMGIDARRDHSFRVPRPDLAPALETPDACTQCHTDKDPDWAAATLEQWFPESRHRAAQFGETLAAARKWAVDRSPRLCALAVDSSAPAIARATALELMAPQLDGAMLETIATALGEREPLVQLGALEALQGAPPEERLRLAPPLLEHRLRALRIEAAELLAPVAARLPDQYRSALEAALGEYRAAQTLNADQPEGNYNLGRLDVSLEQLDAAEDAFRAALARDPEFIPAYLNLADLYRERGDETRASTTLEQARSIAPDDAAVELSRGFALVRRGAPSQAVPMLEHAAALAPTNPTYPYALGVALYSTGAPDRAVQVLEAAHERFPGHAAILTALTTMLRDTGDTQRALAHARALAALLPDDPSVRALLAELQRASATAP